MDQAAEVHIRGPVGLLEAPASVYQMDVVELTRAEPVSTADDRGKVHHVGAFPALEAQMTAFTPDIDRASQGSPDRVDALVWAISDLLRRPPQKATSQRLGG